MQCPSCKADIPEGSKFCLECGAALFGRCPSCGNANAASANFCVECGHKLSATGVEAAVRSPTDTAPQPSHVAGSAERRQLTVLFCDLVGSTALSARLDPEDMREIMRAYLHRCAEVIGKSGGFVAKYMGDGVLAYFGYPQAHEDDAERAVRCGLALVDAAPRLQASHGITLQVRIGIATGVVVVGDLIGEGAAQEQGVVGETPNLAARLQTLAEPGQVVIAPSTRRLTSGLFEYRDLGRVVLKGLADPIRAWRVLAASAVQSRFEAQHETRLAPLVGREEELELLLRRWDQASRGEGRVVLLSGEPGVGKSRLTAALQERLQSQPHVRIRYFCSQQHTDSALYPIINQLERAARFERGDAPAQKLLKLQTLLAPAVPKQAAEVALLTDLLSIPGNGQHRLFEMSPQKRKEKTFDALLAQLRRLDQQRPVLMIFEDVQWIDATTLELLALIVERAPHMRLLLLIGARPEFTPPWPVYAHVTAISLTRLSRREGTMLMTEVAQGRALPDEVIDQILVRTDGVPLFVEELTKTVLESGLLRKREHDYVLDGPLTPVAIPMTLHASLMARLDRLTLVLRQVAQVGSALGRQFSHELLHAAAEIPERQLSDALEQLVRAELLFRRGGPPNAQYTFRHALVQDVAYGSLLRANRQQLHARIARAYETRFTEVVRAQPELVAHHFAEAGLSDEAIEYWQRAGDLAMARSGHAEAIHHFSVALDHLTKLDGKPDRAEEELELCVKLGPALLMVKGPGSPEVRAIYSRAVALKGSEDSSARFKALWGLHYYSMSSGRLSEAAVHAAELLGLAQRLGADDLLLEGHHAKWATSLWCGELAAADEHSQEGMSRYDCARHHALAFTFSGHDPGVCAHGSRAISMALLGFPQQAMKFGAEAVALARSLSHPYSLALAMWHYAIVLQVSRDRQSCRDLASELLELSQEHDFPMMSGAGMFFLGWATADAGELEQGIALMKEGLALFSAVRQVTRPYMLAVLASAKADLGKPDEGLELLKDALASTEVSGEGWWLAELHRQKGRLLVARGQHDESEACFRRAIRVSSEQSARMLELRAATSLARLWSDRGRNTEARDLLAPIYAWFTEGFDTRNLQEAKILLDALAS
jgi:class 3 adenylate cyclase/predicted ATPase